MMTWCSLLSNELWRCECECSPFTVLVHQHQHLCRVLCSIVSTCPRPPHVLIVNVPCHHCPHTVLTLSTQCPHPLPAPSLHYLFLEAKGFCTLTLLRRCDVVNNFRRASWNWLREILIGYIGAAQCTSASLSLWQNVPGEILNYPGVPIEQHGSNRADFYPAASGGGGAICW